MSQQTRRDASPASLAFDRDLHMTTPRAYVVVPFQRQGIHLGPRQAFMCLAVAQARQVAQQLAPNVAGVAILEREVDPETGDDKDTLIAEIGAVPPAFPSGVDWTIRLN